MLSVDRRLRHLEVRHERSSFDESVADRVRRATYGAGSTPWTRGRRHAQRMKGGPAIPGSNEWLSTEKNMAQSSLNNRLSRIEEAMASQQALDVYMWEGDDETKAIAAARLNKTWPDDGTHPVRVTTFRWASKQ